MRRRLIIGAIGASVAGTASAAQWIVTPSLGVQELFTDNLGNTESDKRADAISQLSPGLNVAAEGAFTNLNFLYQPTLSAYVATPSQDRIDQNLVGSGSMVVFQNRLDVAIQTFANEYSGNGNYITPAAGGLVPSNNRVLGFGGSIAPHYQEHFGDVATLDVYYRVNSSNTSQQGGGGQGAVSNGLSNSEIQQDAKMIVGSGDTFGRLITHLNLDHTDGSGSGINTASENDTDTVQAEYHINYEYSVNGSIGYQKIHYDRSATSLGYNNEGLTWNLGFRIAPNDTTLLAVSYGRQEGSYNANAQLNYTLAERTLITAAYVVTVQNQLESAFNNLPFLIFNQFGQPIDSRTGLPYNTADQPFGQQNTLFRDKRATTAITRQFDRSSISLNLYYEEREPLDGLSNNNDSWGSTVTYSRDLTPVLRGYVDMGFNDTLSSFFNGPAISAQRSQYFNADASLTYTINDKLNASVTYSHFRQISNTFNSSVVTDELSIGLRKTF